MPHDAAQPVPPPIAVLNVITGKWKSQALYVAAKLGIADLLRDGPVHCDELARANQMDALALYRVLRALASFGIFTEVADRTFALTPMAECLRSDVPGSLRALAIFFGEDVSWQAWGDVLRSVKTGQPAVDRIFGVDTFAYFQQHPAVGAVFDAAMTSISSQAAAAVVAAYDFAGIKTLVDVGGGHGLLLTTVLKANPQLRGIVFDAPHVVEGARERIEAQGLADRCEAMGGDFFTSVPPGGDAYLMSHIIHDWDEPRALDILRNCRAAMGAAGRLLLVENVIPPGDAPSFGKLLDLEMLVMATGRERTEAEYAELFQQAGLRLTRVVPTRATDSIIEAAPV